MERGPLKIHPQGMAPGLSNARPWHWTLVKSALDPMVAVLVYVALLGLYRQPLTEADLAVLGLTLFVLVSADVPFRLFSAHVALTLLLVWLRVVLVVLVVGALWAATATLPFRFSLGREITTWWLILTPAAMLLLHWATPKIVPRLWSLYPQKRVVMVGVNGVAQRVADAIAEREREGQHFVGYFDDRRPARLDTLGESRLLGRLKDVSDYVKAHRIDVIYISLPMAAQPRVVSLLASLADTTASIHFLPDIFVADPIQARLTTLGGLPVVSVCETPFDGPAGAVKRTLDLSLIGLSLPVLLPLMLLIAACVRVSSPGPVLFRQRRYGLDGQEIVVLKFRTMTATEDGLTTYTQVTRGDSRVTTVGRFLRRTSLDELPQLYNVLCGSMSLVGPRPHALAVNEEYRKRIPRYMVRHKVKPGITGWAQVNGCRGGNDLDSMRRRTEYDLAYLRSWSLALDLLILARTVKLVVLGDEQAY